MKHSFYKLLTIALVTTIAFSSCTDNPPPLQSPSATDGSVPAIIPLPKEMDLSEEQYLIPKSNTICFNAGSEKSAIWLKELLESINVKVETKEGEDCGNWDLAIDAELAGQLGEEGYKLDITNEGVVLKSATEAGLFYGIQTLRQLMPATIEKGKLAHGETVQIPQLHIVDIPKYGWRGSMLDIARNFFDLSYLKKHVDRLALYKFNRFHLHLTDDQGWRIEIKSKPALTEIGAQGSTEGGVSGFITQEEYQELQDYALARNIVIIPEIDMPGHIYAALVSYPELNCDNLTNLTPALVTPPALYSGSKVGWSKFCLTKPETYDFVAEVLSEIVAITKGEWIHIGGDEIEDPLYKTFVVKADSIVQGLGKTPMGWEEVTQAHVSPQMISQTWRDKVESVVEENKMIMSMCSSFYLDHANVEGQEGTNNWCKKTGVSLEDVYNFTTDDSRVLGIEAALWTEFVLNEEAADDRLWPRMIAVAEVAWTANENKDYQHFFQRLGGQADRLNAMGIHYYPTPGIDWKQDELADKANDVFAEFMP